MPIITVEGPPVEDVERKRAFVKRVTDAACEFYPHLRRDVIVVLIKENAAENVASGGELICDRRRE